MWRVAEDPAQLGDLTTQRLWDLRLLRRRVKHLPAHAPVVVHLNAERTGNLLGGAFEDRPVLARLPAHHQPVVVGPAEQRFGADRAAQRGGQLGVGAMRRPEIGRASEQVGVRTRDRAVPVGIRCRMQVGDEHRQRSAYQRQHA
jgi:hypothetical protein